MRGGPAAEAVARAVPSLTCAAGEAAPGWLRRRSRRRPRPAALRPGLAAVEQRLAAPGPAQPGWRPQPQWPAGALQRAPGRLEPPAPQGLWPALREAAARPQPLLAWRAGPAEEEAAPLARARWACLALWPPQACLATLELAGLLQSRQRHQARQRMLPRRPGLLRQRPAAALQPAPRCKALAAAQETPRVVEASQGRLEQPQRWPATGA